MSEDQPFREVEEHLILCAAKPGQEPLEKALSKYNREILMHVNSCAESGDRIAMAALFGALMTGLVAVAYWLDPRADEPALQELKRRLADMRQKKEQIFRRFET